MSDSIPSKILLAKTGIDGHWRGISLVARALRDAGFEVILSGMARPEEIARSAVDEDVDLVGLSVGGHISVVHRILDLLQESRSDLPVFVGGAVAPWAKKELEARGLDVFPPGSRLDDIVASPSRLTTDVSPNM
jgi:methylmalonyl-CoA mutase C-terminal domain/subunit